MDVSTHDAPAPIVVLTPLFNDWKAARGLLHDLDKVLGASNVQARVVIIDDGSTVDGCNGLGAFPYQALHRIEVLELRRNLGHQRAIAVGLAYLEDRVPCDAVVVMDCDGEDRPEDVPRLLDRYRAEGARTVVFAERTRRSESFRFKVFYRLYKAVHYLLTGQRVRVGNFSVVPRANLSSLVVVAELWNHYAAAVFKSRQRLCMVPTTRGERVDGEPKMNFAGLVTHGLSAMSVHGEVIGTRLLMASLSLIVFALAGLAATVGVRLWTNLAIPGWATYTAGILAILLVLSLMLAVIFTFVILAGRSGSTFLPRRDYSYYIGGVTVVYERP